MRPIDADEALKALRKCQTYLYDVRDPELKIKLSSAKEAINNLPTIQPVATDTNVGDTISRQAVIDALEKVAELYPWRVPGDRDSYSSYNEAWQDALNRVENEIEALPSAQPTVHPQRTCVNCGRTVNNGGWYADGRTRCPIEEHYALPKDGYCHLWEKRNVTDDDYPERREA